MGLSSRLPPSRHNPRPPRTKRPLLLLEILIGLTLTALLLSLLFTSITRIATLETKLHTARSHLLLRQHLQIRLQDLFTSLSATLYTARFPHEKHDSLIATFQHGIDPNPAFSGEVLARIYLDEEKSLALALWPAKDDTLWRKEILFPHAEELQFEFLGPENHHFTWSNHWTQKTFPAAIRLKIGKKSPLQFDFLLPSSYPIITYCKGVT